MKLVVFLLFTTATLFAATTARPDSIPSIPLSYQTNKYAYIYATVIKVKMVNHGEENWTRFTVSPIGTYQTFKQDITFCLDEREKLDFTNHDLTVFIYDRVMHRRGCYDLLRIDVIQKARTAGTHGSQQ